VAKRTSGVKARRFGATPGFFESRTTPDDVPDFGWQELCDGGWIETNLSIRTEATSSVMGPWKGPSVGQEHIRQLDQRAAFVRLAPFLTLLTRQPASTAALPRATIVLNNHP